jgi:DNA-binding GntR family transcriptional regulator
MLNPLLPARNRPSSASASREFHISREARLHYEFDETLFSLTGNVIFANFHAARLFAQRMNEKRDVINHPERSVQAGELNAMGLVDEILHLLIANTGSSASPPSWRKLSPILRTRSVIRLWATCC